MQFARLVRGWGLLLGVTASIGWPCAAFAEPSPPPHTTVVAPVGASVEEIQETTVGTLSGVDVGIANMWERDYLDGAGAPRKGLTARLDYDINGETRRIVVGQGSVLEIGGARWEAIRLTKPSNANGTVTLRLLPSP